MSKFGMVVEDPMYDEDGVLIDEDFEFDELEETSFDEVADDFNLYD